MQESKRVQIIEQLASNVTLVSTISKAGHLLALVNPSESDQTYLTDSDVDCLIGLLNEPLLDEVVEERVLKNLCCNFANCLQPSMTEALI